MNYLIVDIFKDFECIADACPNTCCAGWQIPIDAETYLKMLEKEHELGTKASDWIVQKSDCYFAKLTDGHCCMLNENNLCKVVLTIGPEYLSGTCTQYPRIFTQYGDILEVSLTTSCPEVISQLMNRDSVQFDFATGTASESSYEYTLQYAYQSSVRSLLVDILQNNPELSLSTRLFTAFTVLDNAIQFCENNEPDFNAFQEAASINTLRNKFIAMDSHLRVVVNETSRYFFLQKIQSVLLSTTHQERFQQLIYQTNQYFAKSNPEQYLCDVSAFQKEIGSYATFYTNYWVHHIFSDILSIPDYTAAREKFIYIASELCLIQTVSLASFASKGYLDKEEYIYIISSVNKAMKHNQQFTTQLTGQLLDNNLINTAGLLLMTIE